MSEKVLQTKIALLCKTQQEWEAMSSYVPLKGEVCIVTIPLNSGVIHNAPTVLFKVGDGESTFAQLKWASALATDVYAWAKKSNLDFSDLSEDFISALDEEILEKAGTLTTNFRIVETEENSHEWKLQKSVADGEWTDVSSFKVNPEVFATVDYVNTNLLWQKGSGEKSAQLKGTSSEATGDYSVAAGRNAIAQGEAAMAFGQAARALGDYSFAEGFNTVANGAASHAEGTSSSASADHAHAEGSSCVAGGDSSHAEGYNTVTNNLGEHAEGKFNKSNPDTLSSIGIGTGINARKNAVEVSQDGDVYVAGIGDYDGTNPESADSVQDTIVKINENINKKVDKEIVGTNGKAVIFNEADGGGAKFEHVDGTESFVGVNDGGEDGLAAQIYADKLVNGKWTGAKLDVTNEGMYYTVGDKSAAERDIPENEIATKGNIAGALDGLAAIAHTGNVNDLIQTEGDVLILDCNL